MNLRGFYRLAGVVLALMLAIAVWGLAVVGIDAQVPIHWGASGEVNGYGPAWLGFLMTPAVTLAMVALFSVIPRVEPRRRNLERSGSAYLTLANTIVVLSLGLQAVLVLAGTGHAVPVALVIGGGVGILFAVLGNVMGTVRSNFLFGIRTPWTLTSELAWDRTHRLAGRLFVVGGLVTFLTSFSGSTVLLLIVLLGVVILTATLGTIYSYQVWRSDPNRRSLGGDA
ncbi:MAG TPA: SdpI family protein [Candidatus Limnocylindrales bacterium]